MENAVPILNKLDVVTVIFPGPCACATAIAKTGYSSCDALFSARECWV